MNSTEFKNSTEFNLLEQIEAGVKNLPEVEPRPDFTSQVMFNIKEKEKPGWLVFPSLVYSSIFIIFCSLGFFLNSLLSKPHWESFPINNNKAVGTSADYADYADYVNYQTLFVESQQLNLIEIQAKTIEIVYNED